MYNLCSIPDCGKPVENRDTGLCASHSRLQRKQLQDKPIKQPTPIKPISDAKLPLTLEYHRIKDEWLKGKTCALKHEVSDIKCWGRIKPHHKKGRLGDNLLDTETWLPVCQNHHSYIERHPTESYEKGWSELRLSNEPHEI